MCRILTYWSVRCRAPTRGHHMDRRVSAAPRSAEVAMAAPSLFSVLIDVRNDVANVALNGELDLATVPLLEDRLARLERERVKTIMLDLRDLSFLDCSALEAFVSARERALRDGHRLVLIGASSRTRRLFGLTRTAFLLDEQDPAEALDQFTHGQPSQVDQPMGADIHVHAV